MYLRVFKSILIVSIEYSLVTILLSIKNSLISSNVLGLIFNKARITIALTPVKDICLGLHCVSNLNMDYLKDNSIINNLKNKLELYKNAFISDITYIYNLNDLEELNNLTPIQRLHILRDSKKESEVRKLYDSNNLKLTLNNFGDFTEFSITREADAQEIAKNVNTDYLNTYCFDDIIDKYIELKDRMNYE